MCGDSSGGTALDYESGAAFGRFRPAGPQGVEFRLAFWRPFAPLFHLDHASPPGIPSEPEEEVLGQHLEKWFCTRWIRRIASRGTI